jgi:DNA polymerase-3 subunit alpha
MRDRTLIFDTETTGLNASEGDRIIEIGVVEYDGMQPTGRTFHAYLDPEGRQIPASAIAVHGITNEFLVGKPKFEDRVDDFLDFIGDDPLVIHNAEFDLGMLKAELDRLGRAMIENEVIDTLKIARDRFPGKKVSLDVLANRYDVDTSRREKHSAIVDCEILGQVYRHLVQQSELMIGAVQAAVRKGGTARAETVPAGEARPRPQDAVDLGERPAVLTAPRMDGVTPFLRGTTHFSMFRSALTAGLLVKEAKRLGYTHVGLADRSTTAAALDFATAARKSGLVPMVGVELPLTTGVHAPLVLYAMTEEGWRNIQRLTTIGNVDNQGRGLTSAQLMQHREGIAVLSGGSCGALAHVLRTQGAENALKVARFLANAFPRAFAIEIDRNGARPDPRIEYGLLAIAKQLGLPTVATSVARCAKGDEDLVPVVRALESGASYDPSDNDEERLRDLEEMGRLHADHPDALDNAAWFASLCRFAPDAAKPMLPRFETASGASEEEAIRAMARQGLDEHLLKVDPGMHGVYNERYDYEMGLITKLEFSGYFLIVADFIQWAKGRGIPIGPGRGSGAGSIVAWAMGITALDPIKMDLLFERFINPDRVSLPDFDIDMCDERRGEIVDYVRQRYGAERVALIGAYGTLKASGAIKDVGRMLGLPYSVTDRISKAIAILLKEEGDKEGKLTRELMASEQIREVVTSREAKEALELAYRIQGTPKSKTMHAAGVIIADRSISDITALDVPDADKPDQIVTQYDMKSVEKAGLVKFDFLALSTLTIIERARVILSERGLDLDPYSVPLDHAPAFQQITEGHTAGIFQLEKDGMTRSCKEVRIGNFEDIVAMISLYRPGPMEFIPMYAKRKKGIEPFGTPHPLLDDVARNTYGILVYQEQVMQAAQVLAGYTLGQADLLRRAMGKKIQAEMDAQRATFVKGCLDVNQIPEEQANALFDIIDKFAGYGFNRSHAAAYALLGYITSWLKANHPAAFLAAAMDSSIGKGDQKERIVRLAFEARRLGIGLLPPRIAGDADRFTVDAEGRIVWSLRAVKGLGGAVVSNLVQIASDGVADYRDLVDKLGGLANKNQMLQLATCGALDAFFPGRAKAIQSIRGSFSAIAEEAKAKKAGQVGLFDDDEAMRVENNLREEEIDDKEVLSLERDALGLTLSAHPLDAYAAKLAARGVFTPNVVADLIDAMPVAIACSVDEVRMGKGKNAYMSALVSDEMTSMSVGCEETLEGADRIVPGALLCLRVSAYVSKGERRLRIEEVMGTVEDLVSGRTIRVGVDQSFKKNALRGLLAMAEKGGDRLLIAPREGMWTATPPLVQISDRLMDEIGRIEGVLSVEA